MGHGANRADRGRFQDRRRRCRPHWAASSRGPAAAYRVDSISNPQASSSASGMYFEFLFLRAHSRRRVERMYWSGVSLNSLTTCSNDVTVGTTGPIGSGLPQFGFPRRFAIGSFFVLYLGNESIWRQHLQKKECSGRRISTTPYLTLDKRDNQAAVLNPQVLWVMDPHGRNLDVSPRWERETGLMQPQSEDHEWLSTIHPADFQPTVRSMAESRRRGSTIDVQYRASNGRGTGSGSARAARHASMPMAISFAGMAAWKILPSPTMRRVLRKSKLEPSKVQL